MGGISVKTLMTIGQFSKISGVSARTIRYYEEMGLITCSRSEDSNYRLYGEIEVKKLKHILLFKKLGISLEEIKQILNADNNDEIIDIFSKQQQILKNEISELQIQKQIIDGIIKFAETHDVEYFTNFKIIREMVYMNSNFMKVFNELSTELQVKVVKELYYTGSISRETINEIGRKEVHGMLNELRLSIVTNLFRNMGSEVEKNIMDTLKVDDKELFEEIADSMFTIDDIVILDDLAIQKWLRNIEYDDLIIAMHGMKEYAVKRIFKNLSKAAAEKTKKQLEEKSNISTEEVYSAVTNLINILKELDRTGEINIDR